MPLRFCGETNIGRRRTVNQDAVLTDGELKLFVVADGMGGHRDGEVAARLIVDAIHDFFKQTAEDSEQSWPLPIDRRLSYPANRLRMAILLANRRIAEYGGESGPRAMGATLAAVLTTESGVVVANVGDCRTYLLDEGGLRQLTRDHSWIAEQVVAGFISPESARDHPWRHVVSRAIQGQPDLEVDTTEVALGGETRLVVCSDGLHAVLSDEDITRILRSAGDADSACRTLVDVANERGGPDNVSVIVIEPVPAVLPTV